MTKRLMYLDIVNEVELGEFRTFYWRELDEESNTPVGEEHSMSGVITHLCTEDVVFDRELPQVVDYIWFGLAWIDGVV